MPDECGMATGTGSSAGWEERLGEARERLRIERRRVVDEREAFRAFRGRVDSVAAETVQPVRRSGGAMRETAPAPGSGLVAVRDAYVETVMSVPHYADEYDDTYERSVAAEFGPELAYALARTSRFHAEYKRSLLTAVDTAIEERERFLKTVRSETESVERAASRLSPIAAETESMAGTAGPDAGFGALDASRARAKVLLGDCDRIAARRQRELAAHERDLALGDDIDLPTYLYQDLAVTYPVLSAVGSVGDHLDALVSRIERSMTETA